MSRRERREQEEREEKERKKQKRQKRKSTEANNSDNEKNNNELSETPDVKSTKKTNKENEYTKTKKTSKDEKKNDANKEEKTSTKENADKVDVSEDGEGKKHKISRREKNEKNKPSMVKKVVITFFQTLLIIILVAILALGCYVGYLGSTNDWDISKMLKKGAVQVALAVTGQTQEDVMNLDPIYCLVLGVSTDEGLSLTDTIMVCAYYPRTQQASILSIPRDTFVGNSRTYATSYSKINAQYQAYGIDGIMDTVEELTGLDINNYVIINNDGVIELVDAIGGVEFDVPIDMDYDDYTQDLHIHLSAGLQTLDGDDAEGLLRFRHNNDGSSYSTEYGDNDIGRMKTQRAFITETIKQTISLGNISKINELIEIAFDNIETNLDLDYVLQYSPAAIEFDASAIETGYLEGTSVTYNSISFYEVDRKAALELVEELFDFKQEEYDSGSTSSSLRPSSIDIQLLNASGDETLFAEIQKLLEEKGYNIAETGVTSIAKTTKIINRSEKDEDVTNELLETIGYDGSSTTGAYSAQCDFTIIIGQDMKTIIASN